MTLQRWHPVIVPCSNSVSSLKQPIVSQLFVKAECMSKLAAWFYAAVAMGIKTPTIQRLRVVAQVCPYSVGVPLLGHYIQCLTTHVPHSWQRYNCYKHHWSDTRKPVSLEVTPGGIDQIDPHTNRVVCSYDYRNVEGFVEVSDYQGGFCILYGGFSRLVCVHKVCVFVY